MLELDRVRRVLTIYYIKVHGNKTLLEVLRKAKTKAKKDIICRYQQNTASYLRYCIEDGSFDTHFC